MFKSTGPSKQMNKQADKVSKKINNVRDAAKVSERAMRAARREQHRNREQMQHMEEKKICHYCREYPPRPSITLLKKTTCNMVDKGKTVSPDEQNTEGEKKKTTECHYCREYPTSPSIKIV